MLRTRIVSSLEKICLNTDPLPVRAAGPVFSAAKNERVSFQLLLWHERADGDRQHTEVRLGVRSDFPGTLSLSRVGHVPVELPAWKGLSDDDYISLEPGLYPDVLIPLSEDETFYVNQTGASSVFVTADVPADLPAGRYPIRITVEELYHGEAVGALTENVTLDVKNVTLPSSDLIFTQWFHCDSIASYHRVDMMSEEHWKLIGNYIKTAVRTGITMILTPVFTPPLDTGIGEERATMQLVKIEKADGHYRFDFTDLRRFVKLCLTEGIRYFEMAHLFTQWGAKCAPKIVVTVDGREEKLFGWHTAADSPEYRGFLSEFLPALTAELTALGIADRCYFHLSDEPNEDNLDRYREAKAFIAPYLRGFKMLDALSNVEFYRQGLVEVPVPATNHIEPFFEEDIPERWCYYCCGQTVDVSNRMIAMPLRRTRSIGLSMYLYDISGFLQWGYNFYFSELSKYPVDPYLSGDAMQSYPAGDPFSVYPYKDGAVESLRTKAFYEALQDRMLLKALEEKIGKEKTHAFVEELAGMRITFKDYPRTDDFYTALHDKALGLLEA